MSVLALFGPTASGKTAVAEAIAELVPAEIVSADSMQVYDGLPILTAQPARSTRLVAVWPLAHEASVAEYAELAHAAIDEVLADGKMPVVVGGTGLYLRAALTDLRLPPAPAPGARERWEEFYDSHGAVHAHGRLQALDPEAAAAVHANDRRRVVRALELAEGGASLVPEHDRLWTDETRHPTLIFGLDLPADVLARRIEARTDAMFDAGVEEEVRAALAAGPVSATARYAHGLEEIASLTRNEARELMIQRGRRYAAYQRKWMRRIPGLIEVNAERPAGDVAEDVVAAARAWNACRMIRRVEAEDWELLRDVRLRALSEDPDAFLATHAQESAFADSQWQQRATQAHGASFVILGEGTAEGLATGLVADDPATVVLVGMWVAPALRGTGVARDLVARVVDWARSRGAQRVLLSVEGSNERAARLYERCGFTETKQPANLPYEPNEGNRFFVVEL